MKPTRRELLYRPGTVWRNVRSMTSYDDAAMSVRVVRPGTVFLVLENHSMGTWIRALSEDGTVEHYIAPPQKKPHEPWIKWTPVVTA